jgi:hypothetical protein
MAKPKLTKLKLSKPQKLALEAIYLAKHNDLNGQQVYSDLVSNRQLWHSVMGHFLYSFLVPLRDMNINNYHIDTISILCTKNNIAQLKKIARKWNPTHIYTLDKHDTISSLCDDLTKSNQTVLEIWWD